MKKQLKRFALLLLIAAVAICLVAAIRLCVSLAGCSFEEDKSSNLSTIYMVKNVKTEDGLSIVAYEDDNGSIAKQTHTISPENASILIEALHFEQLEFSTDVLKSEFSRQYIITLDDTRTLIINRDPNVVDPTGGTTYAFYNQGKNFYLSGAYIKADILSMIDEMIDDSK